MAEPPLQSSEVPQANQLAKVLEIVRTAVSGASHSHDSALAPRDRAYYVHAAKLLGLLQDDEEVTSLGQVVAGLDDESVRTAVLCEAFRHTAVVRRWMQWARVSRLRQLDPATAGDFLMEESDLGEGTAQRRGLTLRKWWLELCGAPEQRESVRPPPPEPVLSLEQLGALDWNALRAAVNSQQRELALTRFDLPARMCTFIASEELETLGDLLAFRREELIERRNLGRGSIEKTRTVIIAKLAEMAVSGTAGQSGSELDAHGSLFALVRDRLARLPSQYRLVLTHRIGAQGRAMTLEELGALLGVTRERVRQLERDALNRLTRDSGWLEALGARLKDKLMDGAIALSELARDRWFADVDARVSELRFVVERLLDGELNVVDIGERPVLAMVCESDARDAEQRLRAALRTACYPMLPAGFDALVKDATSSLPLGVAALVSRSLEQELQRLEGPHGSEFVAFGSTRQAQVLAFVRAADAPISVREVEERFGRGVLPSAVIHVERGRVWVADRVPGFATWRDRLTPMCIGLMQQEDAERQWAACELLEELRAGALIPEWLNHWHLSSMLRESGRLVDLGRLRFRLESEGTSDARVHVRDIALDELATAGEPLPRERLIARIKQRGAVSELAISGLLSRLPFVMVSKDRWGLVDRDVPGGAEAFGQAMQALEDALRKGDKGFSSVESTALIRALSPEHARWTPEMVRSLARASAVLRGSANGAIGLAEWDDVRVPSQAALIRELLDECGGQVSLADVRQRIVEVHGVEPSAAQIANLAQGVDARVRAGNVVEVALASRVSVPASAMTVSLNDVPGVPEVCKPLLGEILAGPLGEPDDMRARVLAHLERFEQAASGNEFLDVREARELAQGCARLLDLLPSLRSPAERLLACAAVQYFVTPVDAEADLEIGGLDDDVAVFNAIVRNLGRLELILAI